MHYLKLDKDWTNPDGRLVERYYFSDFLHLVEEGYEKFAKSIYEAIVKVHKEMLLIWLRTTSDPEANPDQQHHPKHNRNRTDRQHQ